MQRLRKKEIVLALFLSLGLLACVTINIYFPAEKVESVAGKIVDEIRGPAKKEGKKPLSQGGFFHWTVRLAALLQSTAWADEVTTVENATIRALKVRMKQRYRQTRQYYQAGRLVEGDDGFVAMGNTKGMGLKEKRDLMALREAENRDRKALYEEVARALNIDPGQVDRVARIFAKQWQESLK